MKSLKCVVVTPETTVLDQEASFVALPMQDGEMGIAPGHAPLIGRLGNGELRLRTKEGTSRFYVEGGFVEVADNLVSVMTNRSVPAESLRADAVREQLQQARDQRTRSLEARQVKEQAVHRLRSQLRIAERQGSAGRT